MAGGIHYDSFSFQPLAYIRTAARYRYEEPRQSVFSPTPARLEFVSDARFRDALADLEGFERIWIIAVFHLNVNPDRTANWNPKVRPPVTPEDRKYGVFSTRSPHRPNPIALSCTEIDHMEGTVIHLKSCDLLDGTPVLDIKPYIPEADSFPESAAGWRDQLREDVWTIDYAPAFLAQAEFLREFGAPDMLAFCRIQLSINPLDKTRKRLEQLENGMYAIGCRTWRIHFTADPEKKRLAVHGIVSHYSPDELLPGAEDKYGDKDIHRAFLAGPGRKYGV